MTTVSATPRETKHVPLTAEAFYAIDPPGRCELIDGAIAMMSPVGGEHGRIAARLLVWLGHHVIEHDAGEVFAAETGFVVRRDPDTVRAPDLAFIRADRMDADVSKTFIDVAPDLVAEVVSPGDRSVDVEEKVALWLGFGVRLVWIVWPMTRSVAVHRSGGRTSIVHEGGALDGEDVLPGLQLDLAKIFRARS